MNNQTITVDWEAAAVSQIQQAINNQQNALQAQMETQRQNAFDNQANMNFGFYGNQANQYQVVSSGSSASLGVPWAGASDNTSYYTTAQVGLIWGPGAMASNGTPLATPRRKRIAPGFAFKALKRIVRKLTPGSVSASKNAAVVLAMKSKANGQTALYEELTSTIAKTSVEARLVEAGFGTYLDKKAVSHFTARTGGGNDGINMTPIKNFGRPIPDGAALLLKKARESGLFSGFNVLHAGMAMIKTAAEKIREKDPIIFGLVEAHPDRLYVIADWVDEFCHLTLSELLVHPEFAGSLQNVEVDETALVEEAGERQRLLDTTNSGTWRANEAKAKNLQGGRPWWKLWK